MTVSTTPYVGPSTHAIASPSSAGMWIPCPASVTQATTVDRPSSIYAREGTAAHTIAEMLIGGEMFPPRKVKVENQEFIVSIEMLKHLNGYVSFVEHLRSQGYSIETELKVKLSKSNGWVHGTCDCKAMSPDRHDLHILDLKYGKGIAVSPNTPQIKIYACGALDKTPRKMWPDTIALTVFQPRLNPLPQTIQTTGKELAAWHDNTLLPALQKIIDNDATELAGPHCKFCTRHDVCKAYAERKSTMAKEAFND